MFAHIHGLVTDKFADRVVVEAAGVGFELYCSANTLSRLNNGMEVKLFTHFHYTQDAVALYGFYADDERAMFRKLISVTRVGPKLALSVLSTLAVSDITAAILTDNVAAFDKVSGMGKKTAARVLLELKEKVSSDDMLSVGLSAENMGNNTLDMRTEATEALVSLGYDGASAGRAVAQVKDCERLEDMITQALRAMARKG